MTHKRKAPMWARLKATKRELKAIEAELQTAKHEAHQYKEGYKWALGMLADVTEREVGYVKRLGDFTDTNIELKKQVDTLNAQLETIKSKAYDRG